MWSRNCKNDSSDERNIEQHNVKKTAGLLNVNTSKISGVNEEKGNTSQISNRKILIQSYSQPSGSLQNVSEVTSGVI